MLHPPNICIIANLLKLLLAAPVPINDQVASEPEPLVSSSNPFLLAAEKDQNEESTENEVDSVSRLLMKKWG